MVRIYPKYHLDNGIFQNLSPQEIPINFLWGDKDFLFFSSAREGIHYIANYLKLKREDEVFISTSSDMNYVAACVSATLFNYAKVSRVLTEHTKLIYVIHELGIPNEQIFCLLSEAKQRDIPLLEDCAHGIDSYIHGHRIGTLGDYALYSLPKHLPIDFGGILVGEHLPRNLPPYNSKLAYIVEQKYLEYLPYLLVLSDLRREQYAYLKNTLSHISIAFEYKIGSYAPYTLNLYTEKASELYEQLSGKIVECLPVYIPNWFCIPTQPLMNDQDRMSIINSVCSIVKKSENL
ncbi:MAG: DegT/DnrJ/EryC1/StrS family aminotransferase [Raineya sp.]|nr:DegT/DnrJ/EryC1/StrS family aminotransferase [Raineya sp.]MDW8295478.1 DegT/DnrJ/EryC1/StrS family aminotransferase [Raineya sp.]